MQPRPTSRDVARAAGVSQATVSNVFNQRPGPSEATRERVLAAATALNYHPNLAARAMRTRRTGRIAIVLPMTSHTPARLFAGASEEAFAHGYIVEVRGLPRDTDSRESWIGELVNSAQFEGILSFAPLPGPNSAESRQGGTTVMSLAVYDKHLRVTGQLNDASPMREMIVALAARGYRRFAHITGDLDYPSARARRDTYLATVREHGLDSVAVIEGDWTAAAGAAGIDALPEQLEPLAVIAANDLIATGVIRAATARGWSLPEQLAVTGWDNLDTSAYLTPSLTTVELDFERLGAQSARRLISAIRDEPPVAESEPLLRIFWRESTGDANTKGMHHAH